MAAGTEIKRVEPRAEGKKESAMKREISCHRSVEGRHACHQRPVKSRIETAGGRIDMGFASMDFRVRDPSLHARAEFFRHAARRRSHYRHFAKLTKQKLWPLKILVSQHGR